MALPVVSQTKPAPQSCRDLLALTPDELGSVDIALVNLVCAKGLPGSEDMDIVAVLRTLDDWAALVATKTEGQLQQFHRDPTSYGNSLAQFQMCSLITTLQLDLGVHYNTARAAGAVADYHDSTDVFIHGLVGDRRAGTCASLPVLCVAIGRRLGYPLKLVLAKEHVFCRWQDAQDEFNIDPSGRGFAPLPDEYFRTFPKTLTDQEIASGEYLKSLTPSEELALFLRSRADCLVDYGKFDDAKGLYAEAVRLMPQSATYRANLQYLQQRRARIAECFSVSSTGQLLTTPRGPVPMRPRPVEFNIGPTGKLTMAPGATGTLPQGMAGPSGPDLLNELQQPRREGTRP